MSTQKRCHARLARAKSQSPSSPFPPLSSALLVGSAIAARALQAEKRARLAPLPRLEGLT